MVASQPLVSICIPLFNAREYIAETVDSVIKQTYVNWELIIVDDRSTDGSWDIVCAYKDSRVRCIRNETRLGPEGAWNMVMSEAAGVYLKLLCHDDLLAPRCLERQVGAFLLECNRNVSLVTCARDVINQQGKATMLRQWYRRDVCVNGLWAVRATLRAGTNMIGEPSAVLIKAETAKRIGLFDASRPYVIDLDYWLRLLVVGDMYYLADNLCSFRMSRQSWSSQLARFQGQQFRDLMFHAWRQSCYGVTLWDMLSGLALSRVKAIARRLWFSVMA